MQRSPGAGGRCVNSPAIAANATGYAYKIALGAMCKECLETMETLQKKIQALNQGFANSCQLAKGLVNDVADAFDVKHKDNTSLLGMVKGLGDVFETRSSAGAFWAKRAS